MPLAATFDEELKKRKEFYEKNGISKYTDNELHLAPLDYVRERYSRLDNPNFKKKILKRIIERLLLEKGLMNILTDLLLRYPGTSYKLTGDFYHDLVYVYRREYHIKVITGNFYREKGIIRVIPPLSV